MLNLNEIAHALGGEVSGGQVLAPGPGHSPQDRSMSVALSANADGFVVNSFSGNDFVECKEYVKGRLGLPAWAPGQARRDGGDISAHVSPGTLLKALRKPPEKTNGANGATPSIGMGARVAAELDAAKVLSADPGAAATYQYRNAAGELLYEVLRLVPKSFRQRRPDGNGGYSYKLGDCERVLYRLPELLSYPDATTFVVEGEKDANRLADLGLCSTTISGGSTWTPEIVAPLAGRDVFVVLDNDIPGFKKAEAAAKVLQGVAKSVRLVLLPDLADKGDVSDWLDAGNTKEQLLSNCLAAKVWNPAGIAETPAIIEPLPFVDLSSWRVDVGVPPREWGVIDLIPRRNVALLSGEGAAGKTLLALQLGVAHALGRDWIGTLPEPGSFLYFGAEDETDEIHRRLADILRHYNADFPDIAGKVHLLTFAGEDAVLGVPDATGLVKPTPLFLRLLAAASEIKPIMICLDTSADVFAGNEIDRAQVRQFIGILRKLAIAANAYVLVNSHPSLTGISTGTGLSGSTGWHNSVRSRMYLTTAKTDKDEEPDTTLRRLEFKKSNYGPISKAIDLEWQKGVYKPVAAMGSLERYAVEQNADRTFLALLDRFNGQGVNTSHKPTARNYAPNLFASETEAKSLGIKKVDLENAQRRLFEAKKIEAKAYGPASKETTRLVST